MERISFSLRLLVLFLLKVNSNISLAQPNMSTPVIPVRPSPGFNILPPVMKICQASVCFANQEAKRRFEEANNCIFIKDPCEDLKENQCCGKDPKTGGKLAVDFKKFDRSRRQGASSIAVVSDELSAMLKRIEGRWTQLGEATPLLIWRDKSDQVMQQIGLPPEDYLRRILSELRVHHSLSRY